MPVPTLVSTSPTDGATDVTVDARTTFTFNTALLASSVDTGTVQLYRDDTGELINSSINLSSDRKTITILPRRALLEDVTYRAAVVGASENMPGGSVKASDGTDLPTTIQITFRTKIERYVPLSEVRERSDLVGEGPIREDDSAAAVTGYLELLETDPAGYESNVDRTLSEITVTFDDTVVGTGDLAALELSLHNVLGVDDWYGERQGGTGFLKDWLPDGDARLALFDVEPSGYIVISGTQIKWVKYPDSPNFHYNTEVVVLVRKNSIVSQTGLMLAEDIRFVFTTEYFPLYQGVDYVRLKLGRVIARYFDDTIRRHIHAASIDAYDQAGGCFDEDRPRPAVRRYVLSKVIIDILDELGIQGGLSGSSKRLGDLEVRHYPDDFAKILAIYRRAQADLANDLEELRHYRGKRSPQWVVKGSNNAMERQDFRTRTWQHLRFTGEVNANTADERLSKSVLGRDHPTWGRGYTFIGVVDGETTVNTVQYPWWS